MTLFVHPLQVSVSSVSSSLNLVQVIFHIRSCHPCDFLTIEIDRDDDRVLGLSVILILAVKGSALSSGDCDLRDLYETIRGNSHIMPHLVDSHSKAGTGIVSE